MMSYKISYQHPITTTKHMVIESGAMLQTLLTMSPISSPRNYLLKAWKAC